MSLRGDCIKLNRIYHSMENQQKWVIPPCRFFVSFTKKPYLVCINTLTYAAKYDTQQCGLLSHFDLV